MCVRKYVSACVCVCLCVCVCVGGGGDRDEGVTIMTILRRLSQNSIAKHAFSPLFFECVSNTILVLLSFAASDVVCLGHSPFIS